MRCRDAATFLLLKSALGLGGLPGGVAATEERVAGAAAGAAAVKSSKTATADHVRKNRFLDDFFDFSQEPGLAGGGGDGGGVLLLEAAASSSAGALLELRRVNAALLRAVRGGLREAFAGEPPEAVLRAAAGSMAALLGGGAGGDAGGGAGSGAGGGAAENGAAATGSHGRAPAEGVAAAGTGAVSGNFVEGGAAAAGGANAAANAAAGPTYGVLFLPKNDQEVYMTPIAILNRRLAELLQVLPRVALGCICGTVKKDRSLERGAVGDAAIETAPFGKQVFDKVGGEAAAAPALAAIYAVRDVSESGKTGVMNDIAEESAMAEKRTGGKNATRESERGESKAGGKGGPLRSAAEFSPTSGSQSVARDLLSACRGWGSAAGGRGAGGAPQRPGAAPPSALSLAALVGRMIGARPPLGEHLRAAPAAAMAAPAASAACTPGPLPEDAMPIFPLEDVLVGPRVVVSAPARAGPKARDGPPAPARAGGG